MYSGAINKTSPIIDINTVLTSSWDERTVNDWHIVMTPFFTSFDAVVDAGSVALPFTVSKPVPAMLYGNSGSVSALVIKPGDTAIVLPESGVVQVQVFGAATQLKAVR